MNNEDMLSPREVQICIDHHHQRRAIIDGEETYCGCQPNAHIEFKHKIQLDYNGDLIPGNIDDKINGGTKLINAILSDLRKLLQHEYLLGARSMTMIEIKDDVRTRDYYIAKFEDFEDVNSSVCRSKLGNRFYCPGDGGKYTIGPDVIRLRRKRIN